MSAPPHQNKPLPLLYLGGAVFSTQYCPEGVTVETVSEILDYAFSNGFSAVDTSPYYTSSEQLIGQALQSPRFNSKHPRESYQLLTKVGRYGASTFDYSPSKIRESVENSCKLFGTDYLDAVYLHDVEFVATDFVVEEGLHCKREIPEGVLGKGDEIVLEAAKTLFQLKEEGLLRRVGIAGYPLPALLRLARLIKKYVAPLDILQTYAHHTLQCDTLPYFAPLFAEAGVKQLINASPLSMGLLKSTPPPEWHPAPAKLRRACETASNLCQDRGVMFADLATRFSFRPVQGEELPCVIGVTSVEQLKDAIKSFENRRQVDLELVEQVQKVFQDAGFKEWSWQQPPADYLKVRQTK